MNGDVAPKSNLSSLEGIIERVTYHNSENGFCVLRVKSKSHTDTVTVVGHVNTVSPGEHIVAEGEWVHNKDYGQQLKAKNIKLIPPNTLEGIEKYLGSGFIKGIGPHFASKLVKAFGEKVFEVIEKDPNQLLKIEKFGPKRVQMITSGWKDSCIVRDIMVFLQAHGVSTSRAVRIFKTYGENAIDIVKENPYQLARDISGIGFHSADIIATHLGIDKNSMIRARAGLSYILFEKTGNGHCAYPIDHLIREAEELLEIENSILLEALRLELQDGELVEDNIESFRVVYTKSLLKIEESVSQSLATLKVGPTPWPFPENLDFSLHQTEKTLKIALAPLQKLAIHTALTNKVCVITGGPGTGKSTLTKSLVTYLDHLKIRITLCSPTGRAAKRLAECTGVDAKTIHRLLEFDPAKKDFKHNQFNFLPTDFVLIDEASMVDIQLMNALLKAIPPHAALVIVGDIDQLPPVGPGQVLGDIIQSGTIPVVTLSQIFRQAAESQIVQVAHQINHGEIPDLSPHRHSDFFFLDNEDPDGTAKALIELILHRLPNAYKYNPLKDIQVLCPMQKGVLGARNLNVELQRALNGNPATKVERFGYSFGIGDKVMIIENDYDKDVFNGDIGFIESISIEDHIVVINIDERKIDFDFTDLDIVQPAYAITIHKSQGSEYPVVVIPISTQHYVMLQKNLVYTAITRGKKLVVLIGQKKALSIALKNSKKIKRWTKLKERIQNSGTFVKPNV